MPFDAETKTRMFINCGRLCCLCLKQCGTNIEVAHIVDEHAGGSNDEDNGIPTCFDCHQEIGAYNPKHPKGNKFSPKELKARRDRVYHLVESGTIYAQAVASQARKAAAKGEVAKLPLSSPPPEPSAEGKRFAKLLLSQGELADSPARKLQLLSHTDRAYVIDELLRRVTEEENSIPVLAMIARSTLLSEQERCIVIESVTRKISLFGDFDSKVALLRYFPEETLLAASPDVRCTLFDEMIQIVHRDQYEEVNKLVPVLVDHTLDIPPELHGDYIVALLDQSQSDSFKGAPAARSALRRLPEEVVKGGLSHVNQDYLYRRGWKEHVKDFVQRYSSLTTGRQKRLFQDLLKLSYHQFSAKYAPSDD